jgi:hypothetical protein
MWPSVVVGATRAKVLFGTRDERARLFRRGVRPQAHGQVLVRDALPALIPDRLTGSSPGRDPGLLHHRLRAQAPGSRDVSAPLRPMAQAWVPVHRPALRRPQRRLRCVDHEPRVPAPLAPRSSARSSRRPGLRASSGGARILRRHHQDAAPVLVLRQAGPLALHASGRVPRRRPAERGPEQPRAVVHRVREATREPTARGRCCLTDYSQPRPSLSASRPYRSDPNTRYTTPGLVYLGPFPPPP